jgi:hypothetical protein
MAGKAIKPAPAFGELRQDRVVAVDRRAVFAFIATALLSCVQVVSGDNAARLLANGRPRHGW